MHTDTYSYILIHTHTCSYIIYILIHAHTYSCILIRSHTYSYILWHAHTYSYIQSNRHCREKISALFVCNDSSFSFQALDLFSSQLIVNHNRNRKLGNFYLKAKRGIAHSYQVNNNNPENDVREESPEFKSRPSFKNRRFSMQQLDNQYWRAVTVVQLRRRVFTSAKIAYLSTKNHISTLNYMYVCTCRYVCLCMFLCMYLCLYVLCIYVYVCTLVYVFVFVCVHVCV